MDLMIFVPAPGSNPSPIDRVPAPGSNPSPMDVSQVQEANPAPIDPSQAQGLSPTPDHQWCRTNTTRCSDKTKIDIDERFFPQNICQVVKPDPCLWDRFAEKGPM